MASGQRWVATSGGTRPMAKAPPTAASATPRPHHWSDAFHTNCSAMMPIDTGMMISLTHSGMPMGSILGSSRLASTTCALA